MRQLHKITSSIKKQIVRISHMRYVQDWRLWTAVGVILLIVIFWALPTFAAKAPGQLGYGVKRLEESTAVNLAPTSGWRDRLRLDFATRRVTEAGYVATHADGSSRGKVYAATPDNITPDNTKAANTINTLLSQFAAAYQGSTTKLTSNLTQNKKPKTAEAKRLQQQAVQTYAALALLRVEAPDASQISVLTGVNTVQTNIATVNDTLGRPPLSSSDVSQLTKLVSAGILSKADLNSLINNRTTNRQLLTRLQELVNTEKIPSDLMYSLDQDLVKQHAPNSLADFEAVTQFEQMQRVSAAIQSSRPTAAQQEAVQQYLSQYKVGQPVPTGDIKQFVVPIVYGVSLAGHLQTNLANLDKVRMSSDDQALFDSWKGTLSANQKNLGQLYQQLMAAATNQPQLHARVLARVQQELVDAQQANVAHLVMPPGWGASQLPELSKQMGVEIAQSKFVADNPDTNQQFASLATTQQSLQDALDKIAQTNVTLNSKLETNINTFSGSGDELTTLRETFNTLQQTQTNTVNELRAQVDTINTSRTTLESSIETIRQEQIVNLTELQLQTATNTKELTESLRAELTKELTTIQQQNQTLTTELQAKINSLDSSQTQLRTELTTSLQTIEINQTESAAYLQAQIDSGKATTNQLQTTVQNFQTNLAQQQTDLTNLSGSTDALSQLVNEVKTTSETQTSQLQSQIDGLAIDQTNIKTSIDDLKTQQATELEQLTSQVSQLSTLQTETQVTIDQLSQQQTAAQATIDQLTNEFTDIQSALDTAQQAYTSLQQDVADQQSQLTTYQEQTQLAVDQLNQQQAQLSAQLDGLAADTASLTQTVDTIKTASDSTQAQLDTLLATEPWATIPEGTYVDQTQFDALTAELDAQFAQKAAELDQQFQAYQQLLNAEIQQLKDTTATTSAQQVELEQTVNDLRTQIEALQAQLDATTAPTEPAPTL
jgi:predicted  nucleic acid-binding Zn-ribbon protein